MADYRHAPISRHEALAPFSRDHYVGLVHARRLVKSAAKDRVARHKALADFLDAWAAEILPHFEDEERLLLPIVAPPDRERLQAEHAQLMELADQARGLRRTVDPDAGVLAAIGRALESHIRWEERELFMGSRPRSIPRRWRGSRKRRM